MAVYQPLIPTGLLDLDVDYKNIQDNFSSLNTIYAVNHIPLTDATSKKGSHTFVQMIDSGGLPAGLIANAATLYSKTTTAVTDLYVSPDASGDIYQLTLSDSAHFASFGLDINYAPPVVGQNGGWTFLPGGLLLQYGTSTSGIVVFPIAFKVGSIPIVTATPEGNSNGGFGIQQPITNTGFTITASPAGLKYDWIAIGKQK